MGPFRGGGGRILKFFIQFLSYGLDTWGEGNIGVSRNSYPVGWPIGRLCGHSEPITFWFSAIFRGDFGYIFTKISQKAELWNFVLIILSKNFLVDKRHLKEHQKQFWENIMVKQNFYGVSIVGYFFKFWSKYEGSKNHHWCRNFYLPKKKFFCQVYVFNFRFFVSSLFLSKIIWSLV